MGSVIRIEHKELFNYPIKEAKNILAKIEDKEPLLMLRSQYEIRWKELALSQEALKHNFGDDCKDPKVLETNKNLIRFMQRAEDLIVIIDSLVVEIDRKMNPSINN